jgi:AcrR family transcriptional regulator
VKLIEEKGLEALTLREIGSRLGVSRSAAYRHFADKAALLAAIADAGFEEFASALRDAKQTAPADFASRLQAMGQAYVRFANEHRAYFEVMFSQPQDPECGRSEAGDRAFDVLEQTIREGQQTGEVRPGDASVLARTVWAMVHGISSLRLDLGDPGFVRASGEILRYGLAAPPAGGVSHEPRA